MEAENRLTQWVKEKIEKEYREDIALLIGVTGHATNGDGHGECFDYYVPVNERGNELAFLGKNGKDGKSGGIPDTVPCGLRNPICKDPGGGGTFSFFEKQIV